MIDKNEYTTIRVWKKSVPVLKLAAALAETSMIQLLDDLANEKRGQLLLKVQVEEAMKGENKNG